MKKIIYILTIISALSLYSCAQRTTEYKDTRNIESTMVADGYISKVVRYQYNNHDYIMFIHLCSDMTTAGVVHDPDCHCFQKTTVNSLW